MVQSPNPKPSSAIPIEDNKPCKWNYSIPHQAANFQNQFAKCVKSQLIHGISKKVDDAKLLMHPIHSSAILIEDNRL